MFNKFIKRITGRTHWYPSFKIVETGNCNIEDFFGDRKVIHFDQEDVALLILSKKDGRFQVKFKDDMVHLTQEHKNEICKEIAREIQRTLPKYYHTDIDTLTAAFLEINRVREYEVAVIGGTEYEHDVYYGPSRIAILKYNFSKRRMNVSVMQEREDILKQIKPDSTEAEYTEFKESMDECLIFNNAEVMKQIDVDISEMVPRIIDGHIFYYW